MGQVEEVQSLTSSNPMGKRQSWVEVLGWHDKRATDKRAPTKERRQKSERHKSARHKSARHKSDVLLRLKIKTTTKNNPSAIYSTKCCEENRLNRLNKCLNLILILYNNDFRKNRLNRLNKCLNLILIPDLSQKPLNANML